MLHAAHSLGIFTLNAVAIDKKYIFRSPLASKEAHGIAKKALFNGVIQISQRLYIQQGVGDGPVICQQILPINPEDRFDEFERRMHAVEHEMLVQAIQNITNENFQ